MQLINAFHGGERTVSGIHVHVHRATLCAMAAVVVVRQGSALDNGLGLRPPLGWRSYNAFGGRPTQVRSPVCRSAAICSTMCMDVGSSLACLCAL